MSSTPQTLEPGTVRITRNSNTYLRSRNGAWYGARANPPAVHVVPEEKAIDWVCGSSEFVRVEWPDGYSEHFDLAVTPIRFSHVGTREQCKTRLEPSCLEGYPPVEFPCSRLGKVGYYRLERVAS